MLPVVLRDAAEPWRESIVLVRCSRLATSSLSCR
jgi:hypothetical protein